MKNKDDTYAVCKFCNQEMAIGVGCKVNEVQFPDTQVYPSTPYGQEQEEWIAEMAALGRPCPDCNVTAGQYHHPRCDIERCPRCLGQLLSCTCWKTEVDEEKRNGR